MSGSELKIDVLAADDFPFVDALPGLCGPHPFCVEGEVLGRTLAADVLEADLSLVEEPPLRGFLPLEELDLPIFDLSMLSQVEDAAEGLETLIAESESALSVLGPTGHEATPDARVEPDQITGVVRLELDDGKC